MVESPDIPWARDDDDRGAPPSLPKVPQSAVRFERFLNEKGIRSGRMLVIGCDLQSCASAAHFVRAGFEVHLVGERGPALRDLDLHGVHVYTQGLKEHWLFDDCFFEFVIGSPPNSEELKRVTRKGGYHFDAKITQF